MDNAEDYAGQTRTDLSVRSLGPVQHEMTSQYGVITEKTKLSEFKAAPSFDWQACVKDHPYLALGFAAGAGMLLSVLVKPRPAEKKRLVKTLGNHLAGASRRIGREVEGLAEKPARVGNSVRAAAATMATKALKTYLKRRLTNTLTPGHKRRMWF